MRRRLPAGGAFMTTPNIPTPAQAADGQRLDLDIDHVHELADALLPVYADISAGRAPADENLNAKLVELTAILHELHPADMAVLLESLPPKERVVVWKLAEPEDDGDVLLEVSEAVRETLIESMGKDELLAAVEDLDADDLAELADDLPHQVVYEALQTRDEEEREQVKAAMSYEDGLVGALMDFELVSVRADVSCEVVLRYLRRFESLPDHTDKIFVVDEDDILIGVLPIRKLLVSDPEDLVADVMATDVVRFRPSDDAEEAAQAFERYDLVTAPVIDENNKLIGRIPADLAGAQQPNLFWIDLRDNDLTGHLPARIKQYLPNDKQYAHIHGLPEYGYAIFAVSGNRLSGSVPQEYLQYPKTLKHLLPQRGEGFANLPNGSIAK